MIHLTETHALHRNQHTRTQTVSIRTDKHLHSLICTQFISICTICLNWFKLRSTSINSLQCSYIRAGCHFFPNWIICHCESLKRKNTLMMSMYGLLWSTDTVQIMRVGKNSHNIWIARLCYRLNRNNFSHLLSGKLSNHTIEALEFMATWNLLRMKSHWPDWIAFKWALEVAYYRSVFWSRCIFDEFVSPFFRVKSNSSYCQ